MLFLITLFCFIITVVGVVCYRRLNKAGEKSAVIPQMFAWYGGFFTIGLIVLIAAMLINIGQVNEIEQEIVKLQEEKHQIEERINNMDFRVYDEKGLLEKYDEYQIQKELLNDKDLEIQSRMKRIELINEHWYPNLFFETRDVCKEDEKQEVQESVSVPIEKEYNVVQTHNIFPTDVIKSNTLVLGPYLGLALSDVNYSLDTEFSKGVYIYQVFAYSPAEKVGIKKGGIITSIDDVEVNSVLELNNYKNIKKKGDKVILTVLHGKKEEKFEIILGSDESISLPENIVFKQ